MYNGIPAIYELDADKDGNKLRTMFFCNHFDEAYEFADRLGLAGYVYHLDLSELRDFAKQYDCTVFRGEIVNGFLEFQQTLEIDE